VAYLPTAVYALCFLTSGACALLLGRAYRQTLARVLLWSALCFVLLACNSLVVILDLLVLREVDLRLLRHFFSLSALVVLIFGFIWDIQE
jgi:hypothetical protein